MSNLLELPSVVSRDQRQTREELLTAGFPSPANDYAERALGLDELLIRHPTATFFMRATGDLFREAGIRDGDILVVDRSLEAGDNALVVGVIQGDLVVRRLRRQGRRRFFVVTEDDPAPVLIPAEEEFSVWGVITTVIHQLQ